MNNVDNITDEYTRYFNKIAALPPELQQIVTDNWDYTGRPLSIQTESNVIVALLNKNASEGFTGFKNDAELIFDNNKLSEYQLSMYYNVYVGGAKYIANRFKEDNISKPKLK